MNVLVLGASGMLGNAVVRLLSASDGWTVHGTLRSAADKDFFAPAVASRLHPGIDVLNQSALEAIFQKLMPQLVINCIGQVKQMIDADQPLRAIPINSLLPHRLAQLCGAIGARLVHMSTDCVFSGQRGMYRETDIPDATDLYGRSKLLGEVDYAHAVTLRTSIIGHELRTAHALLNWFLTQDEHCLGYTNAIFSGLSTVELARVIRDHIAPAPDLRGVYHVAAAPIAKYDLLRLVAEIYGKTIAITPSEEPRIDRSLDGSRFSAATGFVAPDWRSLVQNMHQFR